MEERDYHYIIGTCKAVHCSESAQVGSCGRFHWRPAWPSTYGHHALSAGTLTPGNCFVSTAGSGSCAYAGVSGGTAADITWIQLSGFGSNGSGSFLDFGNSGSGFASGSTVGGTIPVSWLLSVSGSSLDTDPVNFFFSIGLNWMVSGGASSGSFYALSGSWIAPGTYSGSGTISLPASTLLGWDASLYTSNSGGTAYSINIPGGSTVDLNPGSATPEPGSILLMGAGGVAMLLVRRRKQA